LNLGFSLELGTWCLVLFSASSARAHPGHGPGEVPPAHLLTNADHLGALLVVGVIGFCLLTARRWFNRNSNAS
jgi:hydrogenase/urease accessory protein HupE